MPAGIWQEEHPSDAAAAAAAWCWLAVVTAGWVPALFASALRVNREQAKCQRIPREADVIVNSLVPDTVLETWGCFLPLIAEMINSCNDIFFLGGG